MLGRIDTARRMGEREREREADTERLRQMETIKKNRIIQYVRLSLTRGYIVIYLCDIVIVCHIGSCTYFN